MDSLDDFLGPDEKPIELKAKDRWEAIDELLDELAMDKKIKPEHRNAIGDAVKKRESSMSTGIGFGIGIPHASTDLVDRMVGAIGRSKNGVQFDALDDRPVKIVFLFLIPQKQFQKHVHTLANIAKLLQSSRFRDELE